VGAGVDRGEVSHAKDLQHGALFNAPYMTTGSGEEMGYTQ
jgi:hypothetical protein